MATRVCWCSQERGRSIEFASAVKQDAFGHVDCEKEGIPIGIHRRGRIVFALRTSVRGVVFAGLCQHAPERAEHQTSDHAPTGMRTPKTAGGSGCGIIGRRTLTRASFR